MESDHAPLGGPLRLAVVTPVYDDWPAFRRLAAELDALAPGWNARVTLLAVDDGSTGDCPSAALPDIRELRVELLRLPCNLGHQRAIAVGLCEAASRHAFDAVVVMDCDGEDVPADVGRLLEAHRADPGAIVAARRGRRSEGRGFRSGYLAYKILFKVLTGKTIDFGNFCLIPASQLDGLVFMPELWNHLAAALVRSRRRLVRLASARGTRYAGRSSMNLVSLAAHGMSAISVFSDVLFVRVLIVTALTSLCAVGVAAVATVLRLTTELALPGWASSVVGLSAVLLFQSITLSAVGAFMMLSGRSSLAFVPAVHAPQYVRARILLADPCPTPTTRTLAVS